MCHDAEGWSVSTSLRLCRSVSTVNRPCAPVLSTTYGLQASKIVGLGCRNGVKADERLYSSLMQVAGQAQRVDLAFELQANMLAQGLQPSQVHTPPHSHPCTPLCHAFHSVCKHVLPCSPLTSVLACPQASCPAHASPLPPPPCLPPLGLPLHASSIPPPPLSPPHPLIHPSQPTIVVKCCPHVSLITFSKLSAPFASRGSQERMLKSSFCCLPLQNLKHACCLAISGSSI